MKIGFFDSGLGGLFILKKVINPHTTGSRPWYSGVGIKRLPRYDYLYLGDTRRSPYGNRSAKVIYQFTREAVDYLFRENCQLAILACNTASALALRKIQREYLPVCYPERRVLGVIVPTLEKISRDEKIRRIGVLTTCSTANSGVFIKEIIKINPRIKIFQQSAPLLVPLVEHDGLRWAKPILKEYLRPLIAKRVDAIILGCTHYSVLKNKIKNIVGPKIKIISQDEIIPERVVDYLERHPEIDKILSKNYKRVFEVTDLNGDFQKIAKKWFGNNISLKLTELK